MQPHSVAAATTAIQLTVQLCTHIGNESSFPRQWIRDYDKKKKKPISMRLWLTLTQYSMVNVSVAKNKKRQRFILMDKNSNATRSNRYLLEPIWCILFNSRKQINQSTIYGKVWGKVYAIFFSILQSDRLLAGKFFNEFYFYFRNRIQNKSESKTNIPFGNNVLTCSIIRFSKYQQK